MKILLSLIVLFAHNSWGQNNILNRLKETSEKYKLEDRAKKAVDKTQNKFEKFESKLKEIEERNKPKSESTLVLGQSQKQFSVENLTPQESQLNLTGPLVIHYQFLPKDMTLYLLVIDGMSGNVEMVQGVYNLNEVKFHVDFKNSGNFEVEMYKYGNGIDDDKLFSYQVRYDQPLDELVVDDSGRTISDIRHRWIDFSPKYNGEKFLEKPVTNFPYKAGKLNSEFLEDALNMVRFVRFLARIPFDIEIDEELNSTAQYGSALMAASEFSHYPDKPADMSEEFYKKGFSGTSSSNIGKGYTDIIGSIFGYIGDEDDNNIMKLGHRRWLLNPKMKKIGFGYVPSFTATYATDRSRVENYDYDSIFWPAAGYFPTQFMKRDYPWSVCLNPNKYKLPTTEEISISLVNTSFNKKWKIDLSNRSLVLGDRSAAYLRVSNEGYGISPCIIFRPSGRPTYTAGDSFEITIQGLKNLNSEPEQIKYNVKFFSL